MQTVLTPKAKHTNGYSYPLYAILWDSCIQGKKYESIDGHPPKPFKSKTEAQKYVDRQIKGPMPAHFTRPTTHEIVEHPYNNASEKIKAEYLAWLNADHSSK